MYDNIFNIYGAGMAGSYLAHYFQQHNVKFNIYDTRTSPPCECAWGLKYKKAKELMDIINIDIDKYILQFPKYLMINGIEIENNDVCTFNRILYLRDLWDEIYPEVVTHTHIKDSNNIIDATGNARAYNSDEYCEPYSYAITFQGKYFADADSDYLYFNIKPYGYAWAFPLQKGIWHIGYGGFPQYRKKLLNAKSDLLKTNNIKIEICNSRSNEICYCYERIYYEIPKTLTPDTIHIGESAGIISALGEGNTLAMESALKLGGIIAYKSSDYSGIKTLYNDVMFPKIEWTIKEREVFRTINENKLKGIMMAAKLFKGKNLNISSLQKLKMMYSILKDEKE